MSRQIKKPRYNPAWNSVLSAVLLLLAFPPFNLGLLVFVALVPWLLTLKDLENGRQAWRSGYLFGLVYILGQMYFLLPFVSRWTGSWVTAAVPWVICGLLGACYFGLFAVIARMSWSRGLPWLIPIGWAGVEVFRSYIPVLSFPWGLIAFPLHPYPALIQMAHEGSVYLVGAWVALVNVVVTLVLSHQPNAPIEKTVRWGGLVCVALLAVSLMRYSAPIRGQLVSVLICQPAIDDAFGNHSGNMLRLEQEMPAVYDKAAALDVDFILMPEGLVHSQNGEPPEIPFRLRRKPPILLGGQRGDSPAYQSAFAYDDGRWTHADKTRLVPFGEYVPGRHFLPFLSAFDLPSGDLTPANHVQPITIGDHKIGALLCFEEMFPEVAIQQARAGAQLLAVMSIDDWYMASNAPVQLADTAAFRAIETGLPVVRSATLGFSQAYDSHGVLLKQAPLKTLSAFPVQVVAPDHSDVAPWVWYFPTCCFIALPILLLANWFPRPRAPKHR